MLYYNTSITPSTTGIKTISCGFQPVGMRITVSAKNGSDTVSHMSIGQVDNTGYQTCNTTYTDTTGGQTTKYTDRMASVLERVSGTITEVSRANFDSFTATQAKFNCTVSAGTAYQYHVEVWG
jgi:hypothetical protein